MTLYAGETTQIYLDATDFDGVTELSDITVPTVQIRVFKTSDLTTPVLNTTTISYDLDEGAWVYNWDTSSVANGSYLVEAIAYGIGATPSKSIEYKRFRLNRRPVT